MDEVRDTKERLADEAPRYEPPTLTKIGTLEEAVASVITGSFS
jgi:hypothetical protein